MKTKLLFIVFLLCISVGYIEAQVRFGVKGGANFNKFSTNVDSLKNNYTGCQLGLAANFSIPFIGLGLQPEILYSINSGKNLSDYVNVPINIYWRPLPIPLIKPVLMAGTYFGYAINPKSDNLITPVDWGIGLGAGLEIRKIQIEGRYSLGLTNIDYKKLNDIKNKKLSISVIYFF